MWEVLASTFGRDTDYPEAFSLYSSIPPGAGIAQLLAGRPRGPSSSPGRSNIFSSRRPDRLWGPPRILSNMYRG
jgi:hypothetical protein